MVSKKKVIINTLAKHGYCSRGPLGFSDFFVRCECGWEGYSTANEWIDMLFAEHVYSKVKKALKKRKKIVKLLKG